MDFGPLHQLVGPDQRLECLAGHEVVVDPVHLVAPGGRVVADTENTKRANRSTSAWAMVVFPVPLGAARISGQGR
jgi:hypothetical protein